LPPPDRCGAADADAPVMLALLDQLSTA